MLAGIGLVAAERKREGIIPMLSLRDNMSVATCRCSPAASRSTAGKEAATVGDWIRRLTIRARSPEQPIGTMSGGNQQKVCLARWLLGNLKVLVLEEPTRGVDVGGPPGDLPADPPAGRQRPRILLISSDAEEVAGLADRSLALADGRVAATFDHPVDASELMSAASRSALAA